jgi:tRNA A-37 threonylcarbamoyl transferase component Bud32
VIDFANLAPGHRVGGRYAIEARVAQGRTSAVYRALDTTTGTRVALKILDPFLAHDEVSVERFRREVRIVRALDHPHIIDVYDFFRDADLYVISMEWVDGVDAKLRLHRDGPLPLAAFLRVAAQLLSALDACHRKGVLHRDLKPQNLLFDRRGDLRLSDFGVSKLHASSDLTKTGTAIGTPEYMAPELFRDGRADPRSDIYALGAVFYELLVGRPPYSGTSLASIMTQQREREIEPLRALRPELPAWLEAIVLRCLRFDPERRYGSPAEIEAELRRGARARATYEGRNRPARCLACGEERVPGLVFCQDCGRFTHEVFQPGGFHLILYRADEPGLLLDYLTRFFPDLPAWSTRLRLRLLRPLVLFAGLSQAAATSLYSELAASFCELEVSERLPAELRLPAWMSGLAMALVPAFLFAFHGVLLALGRGDIRGGPLLPLLLVASPLASAATLYALYRWKIRPLVGWRRARSRASERPSAIALRMVEALREVHSRSTRRLLGGMAASWFALHDLARARGGSLPASLEELLFAAFRTARRLDVYEAHLAGRSLMGIKDELDRVSLRLASSTEEKALEELVEARSELAQELADYREVQELQSRTHLALLAAAGSLEKLRNAEADRRRALEAEIDAVRRDLLALNAGPGAAEEPSGEPALAGEDARC